MKVQFMSDLHLEFGEMLIPRTIGDVLVLAGDIGVGKSAVDWINEAADTFKHVIYIMGNHEFYNHEMCQLMLELKAPTTFKDNVHFLENEAITIDGIKFAACTLWAKATASAHWGLNDSRVISYNGIPFSHEKLLEKHNESMSFLAENADADVFITHHCPSNTSINTERYRDDDLNSAYYTNILPVFEGTNVKHWICGHTHLAKEYTENGITVHQNCRGYVQYGRAEVDEFNPEAIFEV